MGVLMAVDLGEVGGLAAEVLVAHAQEEVARGVASTVLFLEWVLVHDLLNNVLDFIGSLDLCFVLID